MSTKEATHGPGFKSRTGSSKGYYKRNGELIAITHPVPMSSALMTEKTAARGGLTRWADAARATPVLSSLPPSLPRWGCSPRPGGARALARGRRARSPWALQRQTR